MLDREKRANEAASYRSGRSFYDFLHSLEVIGRLLPLSTRKPACPPRTRNQL